MLAEDELHRLLQQAHQGGLTLADLQPICQRLGLAPNQLLNALSIATAKGFVAGTMSYEFGDEVMNGLASAIFDAGMTDDFADPAFSIYQAFDDGEWRRSGDPATLSPVDKYTRPQVEQILRDLESRIEKPLA